jgi:hypothetical protein
MGPRYEAPISDSGRAPSHERRARNAVRLDENRWPARMRERAECGGRMAEEFGDRRPDGRKGQRSARGRRCRLVERGREVLAERAIAGMNPGALRAPVRFDVRGGIRTVARRFELRIGQRRGGRSDELDQRDNQRQEPQLHFAQTHEMDANTGCGDPATRNEDAGSLTGTLDACGAPGVSGLWS